MSSATKVRRAGAFKVFRSQTEKRKCSRNRVHATFPDVPHHTLTPPPTFLIFLPFCVSESQRLMNHRNRNGPHRQYEATLVRHFVWSASICLVVVVHRSWQKFDILVGSVVIVGGIRIVCIGSSSCSIDYGGGGQFGGDRCRWRCRRWRRLCDRKTVHVAAALLAKQGLESECRTAAVLQRAEG